MRSIRNYFPLFVLLFSLPVAAAPLSDGDISRLLVGTWIADPDHLDPVGSDAQELERHSTEVYNADHTGSVTVYTDTSCTKALREAHFTWTVHNGQIYAHVSGGLYTYFTVVSIDARLKVTHIDQASNGPIGVDVRYVKAINCTTPQPP